MNPPNGTGRRYTVHALRYISPIYSNSTLCTLTVKVLSLSIGLPTHKVSEVLGGGIELGCYRATRGGR